MLRIKKDIDLKELEKKGFKKAKSTGGYIYYYPIIWDYGLYVEIVVEVDRTITLDVNYGDYYIEDLNILYDIITAGYVEKVEE